ncbi:MAG TPA: response regulator transcription factor [Myxococcales bacterium]|nr:response regulator transcription factor [Myxococcales bacterium]
MSILRVVLADDHALVRAGFRSLLEALPGIQVVGEAADGREALRLIGELRPDLALIDIAMPGLNGLEVVGRAAKEQPRTRVIVVSMHAQDEYVRRALVAGAAGYMLKHADGKELEMAIRAVAAGETWLSPSVSKKVVAAYSESARGGAKDPLELLTGRQREILQLIAEGHSRKEIAQRLQLSVKTVESHRAQLAERLGTRSTAELVRWAVRHGIVAPDS